MTESGTTSGSTIWNVNYALEHSREKSSEIETHHGWPWRVATNFGENNVAMLVMRLLLRGFSIAFLTHDNAF